LQSNPITLERGEKCRVCLARITVNPYLFLLLRTLTALPAPRGRSAVPDARPETVSLVSTLIPDLAFSAPPGT
jgi:hypothetical protein